jgi:hypothetical protein
MVRIDPPPRIKGCARARQFDQRVARDGHRGRKALGGRVEQAALKIRLGRECDGVHQNVELAEARRELCENRVQLGRIGDIERQKRLRIDRLGDRAGITFRLFILTGQNLARAAAMKGLCTARRDRGGIGDADNQSGLARKLCHDRAAPIPAAKSPSAADYSAAL